MHCLHISVTTSGHTKQSFWSNQINSFVSTQAKSIPQKELHAIQTIIYLNKVVLSAGYDPCNRVEYNCRSGLTAVCWALLNYETAQCINLMLTVDKVWMMHCLPMAIYWLLVIYIVLATHINTFFSYTLFSFSFLSGSCMNCWHYPFEKHVAIQCCLHQTQNNNVQQQWSASLSKILSMKTQKHGTGHIEDWNAVSLWCRCRHR